MGKSYGYIMIPLDQVPKDPSYPVWFGTWSSDTKKISWSQNKPDALATWAVAVAVQDLSAPGATMDLAALGLTSEGITSLGVGTKDPPIPPSLQLSSPSSSAFQDAFSMWLVARNA